MQTIFFLSVLVAAVVFLFKKRRFDYYSLAFLSSVIYFSPGFFGATGVSANNLWWTYEIADETYGVMSAVVLSITIFACLYDTKRKLVVDAKPSLRDLRDVSTMAWILLILSLVTLAASIYSSGATMFEAEKSEVLDSLDRWHIVFYSAATMGLPLAYAAGKKKLFIAFFLLLFFNMYIGFRSPLAIAVLSVMALAAASRGMQRFAIENRKLIAIAVLFGLFLFFYKSVGFAVKDGRWDLVAERFTWENIFFTISASEPFVVQNNLNAVIDANFKTPLDHIYSVWTNFIFFAPEFGFDSVSFNSYFQPYLFSDVDYGLAANIWAQMWSAGGWILLIFFLFVFNGCIWLLNASLESRSLVLKAGMASVAVYWCFYIHRNDLGYQLSLEKRQLLILLFAWLILKFIRSGARKDLRHGSLLTHRS